MTARAETRVSLPEEQVRRLQAAARAQEVSEDQLIERALDILLSLTERLPPNRERAGWAALSESSLARIWDNEEDARYDDWHELYGAPSRWCRPRTVPFSDLSTTKVRPAAVVSSARYHAHEPDILLVALTSQVQAATGPFDYVLADWRAANLRFPSAFKPVLLTLDPSRVVFHVGRLTARDREAIEERLRLALGL
jgi:mRNA interferase MazF